MLFGIYSLKEKLSITDLNSTRDLIVMLFVSYLTLEIILG